MRIVSGVSLAVVLIAAFAAPAQAQDAGWQNRWYWGAQGSMLRYKTPTMNWSNAYAVGASWLITKRQGGLYVAFDQAFFDDPSTLVRNGLSPTGFTTVTWEHSQRWQALLYAVPMSGAFQLYLGAGFAIHNITDAVPDTTGATQQEIVAAIEETERRKSRAFLTLAGGLQLKLGRLAVFGDYHFMPASDNFLITSSQHVFIAGIRFAVTSSQTQVGTAR
jgi:opacity protein-like surface antigen